MKAKVTCELRRNKDGTIDEAILYVDGSVVMHLEQLNESEFFLGLYHGKRGSTAKGRYDYENVALLTVGARNGRSFVDATVTEEMPAPAPSPRDEGAKTATKGDRR